MKINKHIYYAVVFLAFASCDDYLDVEPKGLIVPNSIEHYDLLLNGGNYTIHSTTDTDALFFTADDWVPESKGYLQDIGDTNDPNNEYVKLYTWATNLFDGVEEQNCWNLPYKNIYTYNLVIQSIDEAVSSLGYSESDKKVIKAEAKVGRAYEYWLLVNTFAQQYSEAKAATDPGVPLVTVANASQSPPSRASVEEVYDLIINDVEESIEFLPDVAKNSIRPSKAAAYALLARFYLSMNNYEEALKNASLAISEKGDMADYTTVNLRSAYESDQYFIRYYGDYIYGFYKGRVSDDLFQLFDSNDKRLSQLNNCTWLYYDATGWEYECSSSYRTSYSHSVSNSVSIPEMYLIRAECNTRLPNGTVSDVLMDLNNLRAKRITNYVDLQENDFSNKNELLTFVLEERRREMFMIGTRLFDVKRLNLEPATSVTIVHTLNGEDYILPPGANNLVLPIPSQVLNYATSWSQNPRD